MWLQDAAAQTRRDVLASLPPPHFGAGGPIAAEPIGAAERATLPAARRISTFNAPAIEPTHDEDSIRIIPIGPGLRSKGGSKGGQGPSVARAPSEASPTRGAHSGTRRQVGERLGGRAPERTGTGSAGGRVGARRGRVRCPREPPGADAARVLAAGSCPARGNSGTWRLARHGIVGARTTACQPTVPWRCSMTPEIPWT